MESESGERRLRLIAARCGLKLIKNRRRIYSHRYCLRALNDASHAVGRHPNGTYGLIKASTKRYEIGSWLPLTEIEKVLTSWDEPVSKSWGEPRGKQKRVVNAHSQLAL